MPQETLPNSNFISPLKRGLNLKGSAASACNNNETLHSVTEETINDHELAQRKAEEAASRRYVAAEWLRQMDNGASSSLSKEPSEEEFCLALRNGLILCNVLNRVNPGAVVKVVDNAVVDNVAVQSSEGPAQSAIQYFENMRNFLEAVNDMKLLTFEASDLEKGGSSSKVVDCILCLKGYYEWKLSGGIGVWRYGGTVRITSFPKWSSSNILGTESVVDETESSQFLHLSGEVSVEETKAVNALASVFDQFGLKLFLAYLREADGVDDLPLNAMVIDTLLRKVVNDFSALLDSQGTQLGHFLKKILKGNTGCLSKREFIEAITLYLNQRRSLASNEFSKLCTCGGKRDSNQHNASYSAKHAEISDAQQKELEKLKYFYEEIKLEVKQIQSKWDQELRRLGNDPKTCFSMKNILHVCKIFYNAIFFHNAKLSSMYFLESHIKSLEEASSSYHKVLEENRSLYNQVQDLKGAIRVYCRVRPFLPGQSNGQSTVDYIGDNGNIMIMNPHKQGKDARRVFSFNKVFATSTTQEQIYADTQPLVRSALDGYNVCIFAYGQTGSGKTYTMSGPDLMTEETWGVNYRALRDLFHISKERADAIKYEVGVQMIEIYNEQVRDLLVSDGSNRRYPSNIRNNSQLNGLNVPDASLVPVNCTQDVLDLMKIGQKNRAVGATALNERSSRSHSVLTVHVRGRDLVSNSILKGCLHLVDLAGSERVDKSEAVGERLKEAQHINKSLSALGDVISALAQKSPHIPYRNSKLTQVLQDSLGGHAKTLMFVHINPEVNALGETISTLKFAERVATIELGAAQSNKETGEIRELKEEISNIKSALERKETELQQWKAGNARNAIESQNAAPRAVSPFRLPKNGTSDNMKPENCQRPMDDRSSEAKTCSSGKQRRSRFPSTFIEKDSMPKMSLLAEEKLVSSGKGRSPSPPVRRRSISTDRGSVIKSKVKSDTSDNQPILKHPFPTRVLVNKLLVTMPMASSTGNNSRVNLHSQEPVKQDNTNETLFNHQKVNSRKVHQEHEEEQIKQAPGSVRQGGTRKNKAESKAKVKHFQHLPFRIQKADMIPGSDMEIGREMTMEAPRKSDYFESENDIRLMESAVNGVVNIKKIHQNISRNSQNIGSSASLSYVFSDLDCTPFDKSSSIAASVLLICTQHAIPEPHSKKKTTCKDNKAMKIDAPQSFVTFVYQTKVAELLRSITVSWCKDPIDHFLSMSVDNTLEENKYTCKIDLGSGQSWGKKGLRSFEIAGVRVDIFWDFRRAEFSATSPQPCSGYYVALVYKKEVLLLLGDLEKDAFERTKSKPSLDEATLLCKRDNVYGKKMFCTRAILEDGKIEHDVVIETSLSGPDDPEMWINIDGMLASRIMNLHWRFRGNEIVMVNNFPVQIFWDVHDWLFTNDLGLGPAFFVFKPIFLETTSDFNSIECPERGGGSSKHELLEDNSSTQGFCHYLYAWRIA
ncbi:hypothetical protein JHK84_038900 [Glycine max]|nr:hypothetical protein JHK84_038900 [Glycine max]